MNPARMDMTLRLRTAGISDNNVLRAMETLPRSAFVDSRYSQHVYSNRSIPIACGQTLPDPLTTAVMCQAARLTGEGKVLEIGTGSGYGAAILSTLCTRVYSVERYQRLLEGAQTLLTAQGIKNVVMRHGDGRFGWRGQAPFDVIVVTAGLGVRPVSLIQQLKPNGTMVCVLGGVITVISPRGPDKTLIAANLPLIEAGKSKAL